MTELTGQTKDTWFYVIVQNPGSCNEQFVGYTDKDTGSQFIPVFKTKEIAQQCFLVMPKDIINEKYEPQAVIKDDLLTEARKNDYELFLLDEKGSVLEKIA